MKHRSRNNVLNVLVLCVNILAFFHCGNFPCRRNILWDILLGMLNEIEKNSLLIWITYCTILAIGQNTCICGLLCNLVSVKSDGEEKVLGSLAYVSEIDWKLMICFSQELWQNIFNYLCFLYKPRPISSLHPIFDHTIFYWKFKGIPSRK